MFYLFFGVANGGQTLLFWPVFYFKNLGDSLVIRRVTTQGVSGFGRIDNGTAAALNICRFRNRILIDF